ncbi:MAG: hypothetical protein M1819_006545 [Sarea resinae]|nr:MAG: hypothetical protein M1819_006545 [Sarea resinae]
MAYLMHQYHITVEEALSQVRQARPMCEPNSGFMKQLELYHQMQYPDNLDEDPVYQRWLYQREVDLSLACGRAPEKIRFEDEQEHSERDAAAEFDLRCRKCRYGHLLNLVEFFNSNCWQQNTRNVPNLSLGCGENLTKGS